MSTTATHTRLTELDGWRTPATAYPSRRLGRAEIAKERRGTKRVYWAEGVKGHLLYKYKTPAMITVLKIGGNVWMTDEFPFMASLESFAERASGDVLVAGLGLGLVVHQLVRNKSVNRITVVERESDVIEMVSPLLPDDTRIAVVRDDFYRFVKADAASVGPGPDTIIWDLAVGSDGRMSEGKEILYVRQILHAEYGNCGMRIFVHGLDRDPVGEEFVQTEEFRTAVMAMGR